MADVNPDAVKTARQSGYSDDEIVSFLAQKNPDQFKAALDAGYNSTEILNHLSTPKDTSYVGAVQKGLSDVVEGVGKTIKNYVDPATGQAIEAKGQKVEPKNYKSATDEFMNRDGAWYDKKWSAAPRALVEQAPGLATDVIAGLVGKKLGGGAGALVGTGLSQYLRTRGDAAEADAAYRTGDANAPVETQDKVRAAITGIPEAVIASLGARGLVSPARGANTGFRGAAEAVGNLGKTSAAAGGAGGAQATPAQVGQSVGTDKGLNVDPGEVFGNAALSAGTAAGLRSVHTAGDINNARRFRDFDTEASQRVANRIQDNAQGDLGNVKTAREAVGATETDIKSDLSHAFDTDPNAKAQINANDASRRALSRFNAGEQVTDADLSSIADAAQGTSAADRIASLTREAVALRKLKDLGTYGDTSFKGGVSSKMEKGVRAIYNPVGALTGAGLAAAGLASPSLAAGVMTSAPHAVAGAMGAYVLARALDKSTGYRSPADTFVRKFGGTDAVTPAATPDVREPQNPTGPRIQQAPTFNGKPVEPPFGTQPVATPTDVARRDVRLSKAVDTALTRGVDQQNRVDANQDASVDRGADFIGRNALAQIRAERRIEAMKQRQEAQAERQAQREQITDAKGLVDARKGNLSILTQDAREVAQAKRANDAVARRGDIEQMRDARETMAARRSPDPFDRAQMGDARELMAARRAHEKLQRQAEAASSEAEDARQAVGSDGQVSPDTLKAAQKLVKSLTAVQKIKDRITKSEAQVAKKEAAQAKANERAQAKAERAAVMAAKATAKVNGKSNGTAPKLAPEGNIRVAAEAPKASPKADSNPLHLLDEAPWAYADDNAKAAKMVLAHELQQGRDITNPDGYRKSTQRRLDGIEGMFSGVMKEAQSNADKTKLSEAMARMKSARSQTQAVEYREAMKQAFPALADSIDRNFSDSRIKAIWKKGT